MRFALNQTGFPTDDVDSSFDCIGRAGFDGVEPNLQTDGPLHTAEGRRRVADAASDRGLSVPSVSTTVHWEYPLSATDSRREEGLSLAQTMVDAAEALGADTVLIVPGVLEADVPYERAYDVALATIRDLAQYAAGTGVTVALENVGNDMFASPLEFREFVDDAAQAGPVGVYLDVGNLLYYGQHPAHWLDAMGDRVAKVHVKGFTRDGGTTYPLVGDVDWPAVRTALDDVGYDGWVTAEVPPYEHAPRLTPRHVLESVRVALGVDDADPV